MIQNPIVGGAGDGEKVTITLKHRRINAWDNNGISHLGPTSFEALTNVMIAAQGDEISLDFYGDCTIIQYGRKNGTYLFIPHGNVTIERG
jgi:hypothetical protein|nr:MAG TPA: hypothetical protein [Caudoviricetes sp.]